MNKFKLSNKHPEGLTQIGLHSARNMFGIEKQLSLFSDYTIENLQSNSGINLDGKIERLGIELTDVQSKIVEGLLRGFTETNYQGNIDPIDISQIEVEKYSEGDLPPIYKYVKQVPRLRASQSQIMEWAGVNKSSMGEKERAVEALRYLGVAQYCFYYDRLSYSQEGIPEKDRSGRWKKEEVVAVDTLFTIKEVREEQSSSLKYYEIEISPIFLDQRESYFMLIPYNWREEVRSIVGSKKASSYTFRFLLFLRYQFEMKRRSPKLKPPFSLKWSWEEIAVAIKMPESVYKRQKTRANKILEDAYSVAQQLGYLSNYERCENTDTLIFNTEKYNPKSKSLILSKTEEKKFSEVSERLFEYFHSEKTKIDKAHKIPVGVVKKDQLQDFEDLLLVRSFDEIFKVIKWGFNKNYWCTRIGTPKQLLANFSEAVIEMNNSFSEKNEDEKIAENKKYAQEVSEKIKKASKIVVVEVLNSYVEIGDATHQPKCIRYTENGFKEQLENELRKWNVHKYI